MTEPAPVPDLLAALEESLNNAKTPEERRQVILDVLDHSANGWNYEYQTAESIYDRLMKHLDEHEPFTANTIRNGPPTVEQLTAIIVKLQNSWTVTELAEAILRALGTVL